MNHCTSRRHSLLRADKGTRTLNNLLGRQKLYQLSYVRILESRTRFELACNDFANRSLTFRAPRHIGAEEGTRTLNLSIGNALLYQLSYFCIEKKKAQLSPGFPQGRTGFPVLPSTTSGFPREEYPDNKEIKDVKILPLKDGKLSPTGGTRTRILKFVVCSPRKAFVGWSPLPGSNR